MKPTMHSPGVTPPAVFGPMTHAPRSFAAATRKYIVSCTGMCSVRHTSPRTPASMVSRAASLTITAGRRGRRRRSRLPSSRPARWNGRARRNAGCPPCRIGAAHDPGTVLRMRSVQNVPCLPVMPMTSMRSAPRTIMAAPSSPLCRRRARIVHGRERCDPEAFPEHPDRLLLAGAGDREENRQPRFERATPR